MPYPYPYPYQRQTIHSPPPFLVALMLARREQPQNRRKYHDVCFFFSFCDVHARNYFRLALHVDYHQTVAGVW